MKKVLLVLFAVIAFGAVADVRSKGSAVKWRHGITADDKEFWAMCKQGAPAGARLARASSDCARNVKAMQIEGTKKVRITYDVDYYQDGWPLAVSVDLADGSIPVPCSALSGDIDSVYPGKGKVIEWDAGIDWNGQYTENMVATVTAIPAEHPSTWASVQISWASYGGRDLDVCGYWVDVPSVKVGYSYGTGSQDAAYLSDWEGDNTGSGPEYINIGVKPGETLSGVCSKIYKVHCNYFGEAGNPPKATIKVTCNGKKMSKTITASTRTSSPATMSDPCVTITFNEAGELMSVQ